MVHINGPNKLEMCNNNRILLIIMSVDAPIPTMLDIFEIVHVTPEYTLFWWGCTFIINGDFI